MSETEGDPELTVDELAARVGVPVRTLRFYIAEKLLPGPSSRGRGASYGRDHLLRLRLIRRLAERRVPIAEIRDTLTRLSTPDVESLLQSEDRRAAALERTSPATSPRDYVAQLLTRSFQARPPPGPPPGPPPASGGTRRRPPRPPRAPPSGSAPSWRRASSSTSARTPPRPSGA